ncbi:ammonium transporter [Rhodococcus pyridinivorans]|uniref:Ammonium transporter n=4 Tax=Rhodococcus TaxID=1827 RepID=V9XAE6_9NOCA|nr:MULTISPECIES: ammonium transporter [Rhodococcus]AHD19368.1 ammonium transporter [Rhodococcus pyridinivorans SB3094]AOD22734.1 ammonium transporter [Rhodococcus sp. p52]APE08747.1 ammonium transporter [Rhodococcus sp. 2G]AWZ24740.1 ammonium transporter [Rhodococcus pyridinivorans]EHK85012.1 ammonium transporter AmtB [Rhodococcus pyridinivorans AK37]
MEEVVNTGDAAWMLIAASLVLLMTPGLAFFYGGMSRSKSVLNMMMMSFGAMAVIGVIYVLWGWSMSYGNESVLGIFANPFEQFGLQGAMYGEDGEFLASGSGNYPQIIDIGFQVTFAIITTALISGALAERVKFGTWMAFAAIWVTCAYFPLAHMVWGGGLLSGSEDSIAAAMFGTVEDGGEVSAAVEPIDFAGGTVVHINAGIAALVLAVVIGKRAGFGRTAFRPHNLPFVMLGAALLWFGWFGFNAGSAFAADGTAGLAWVNTTTATAAAILGWLLTERIRDGKATSLGAASGTVAGLVAITPAAGSLSPVGSIALGVIAGVLSALAVGLKYKFGYDDSLDVVGVHLVSGLWGTVAIGFLGTETGLFYGGDYKQLVIQIVIAVVALVFTAVVTAVIAFALKPMGWRVSDEEEARGIDEAEHAESAYDFAPALK